MKARVLAVPPGVIHETGHPVRHGGDPSFFLPIFCQPVFAEGDQKLNLGAGVEYGLTGLQRNPSPIQADTGLKPSQQYELTADGGMFKQGLLDAEAGFKIDDRYSGDTGSFEDKLRYNYGSWLEFGTSLRRETDEEIFFSGTNEPQSPIHTVTKKHSARLAPTRLAAVEFKKETLKRKDLFLGTVVNEETRSEGAKIDIQSHVFDAEGEYRTGKFDDLLGQRSDVDSEDFDVEFRFKPRKFISFSGSYDDNKDTDVDNRTQLHSKDIRFNTTVKLAKTLKVQGRLRGREDNDTRTQEDIERKSGEVVVNYDPLRSVGLEAAYQRENEDKDRNETAGEQAKINSSRNKGRAEIKFTPISPVTVRGGYEISDKGSSLASENLRDHRIFSDLTLKLLESLRLGGGFLRVKRRNTKDSSFESNADSFSFTMQHTPKFWLSSLARLDLGTIDNPETGAFTKTNTISSNITVRPTSLTAFSLRTSGQTTEGSSQNAASERLLNALKAEFRLLPSVKATAEYEIINTRGTTHSDENLIDLALFYTLARFDGSMRWQIRVLTGDNPTAKNAILINLKYRLSKNTVLSLRFSYSDYEDRELSSNSYDSLSLDSLLSMRF